MCPRILTQGVSPHHHPNSIPSPGCPWPNATRRHDQDRGGRVLGRYHDHGVWGTVKNLCVCIWGNKHTSWSRWWCLHVVVSRRIVNIAKLFLFRTIFSHSTRCISTINHEVKSKTERWVHTAWLRLFYTYWFRVLGRWDEIGLSPSSKATIWSYPRVPP